jgi:hypothetical protein
MPKQITDVGEEDKMNTKEFEPMDVKKLPHFYTVSDTKVEAVRRQASAFCEGGTQYSFGCSNGMMIALELLGLPS